VSNSELPLCEYFLIFIMQHLKNKLGTRQLPTAEILLDGADAYLVNSCSLVIVVA
jgi:hypothetical protein